MKPDSHSIGLATLHLCLSWREWLQRSVILVKIPSLSTHWSLISPWLTRILLQWWNSNRPPTRNLLHPVMQGTKLRLVEMAHSGHFSPLLQKKPGFSHWNCPSVCFEFDLPNFKINKGALLRQTGSSNNMTWAQPSHLAYECLPRPYNPPSSN